MRLLVCVLLCAGTTGCSDFYEFFGLKSPDQERYERDQLKRFYFEQANVSEPTIDVIEVAAGQTAGTDTEHPRVGVGVKTLGGPAPDSAYSNFVELRVRYVDIPGWEISVLKQRHDNVPLTEVDVSTAAQEDVDANDVFVVPHPWGFYFEFPLPEPLARDLTFFEIFLGFMETDAGPFLEDETGDMEFDDTEPLESILDEIEHVFVPA